MRTWFFGFRPRSLKPFYLLHNLEKSEKKRQSEEATQRRENL